MRDGSGGSSLIAEGVGSSEGDTGRLGAKHTEFKNTCMARESSAQLGLGMRLAASCDTTGIMTNQDIGLVL